jgi:hypothetical protein
MPNSTSDQNPGQKICTVRSLCLSLRERNFSKLSSVVGFHEQRGVRTVDMASVVSFADAATGWDNLLVGPRDLIFPNQFKEAIVIYHVRITEYGFK